MPINFASIQNYILNNLQNLNRKHGTVAILFFINLLNYMDRFTIAGIPQAIQKYYSIQDFEFGLLQTSFIVSYMTFSLLFGYLGDRWKRKYIMMIGLFLWSTTTLFSSFVPRKYFWVFLFLRCLIGIGEASYATISPSIISDLFAKDDRTKILGLYYFAVPLGSGLGYVVGSTALSITDNWKWALRITPIMGFILLGVTGYFHKDPPRGEAENGTNLKTTSVKEDLSYLLKNKSFILISLMFTSVCFVIGSLTWWSVKLIESAINAKYQDPSASLAHNIPLIFGASVCFAGVIGVVSGEEMARRFRKYNIRSDVIVCIFGQLISAPILYLSLLTPIYNFWLCFFLVFLVNLFMCLQWAIVSDITLSVIIPTRRNMGNAIQTLSTHLLGDAISPSVVGSISDALAKRDPSLEGIFYSLRDALLMTPFVALVGGIFAMLLYFTVIEDKTAVINIIKESHEKSNDTTEYNDNPDEYNNEDSLNQRLF